MTIVSKSSAYPATVQPGIPRLLDCPDGWACKPLSNYLYEARRPIKMADESIYRLVTVKRGRGGVVVRENLAGRDISVKSQSEIKTGDFLISKRQIVHGACGLVPSELEGSIVSNEYSVLRGNDGICLNYLNYLAHSVYFQQTCFHSSIGVHVEKMIFKLDRWLSWDFLIPPISEQKRIAKILSTWDRAIEVVERLIENSQAQKKALMQQLLTGKKRLPGFDGEWQKITLVEVCEFIRDGTHGTHKRYTTGVPMLSAVNISKSGEIIFENTPLISADDYNKIHSRYIIQPKDVLVTVVGTIGRSAIVTKTFQFTLQRSVAIMRPNTSIKSSFLYHLIETSAFQNQLRIRANVTAQPGIYLQELGKIPLLIPENSEQEAIVKILNAADKETTALEQTKTTLKQEKSALMQQLLTGKRRVKIDKESVIA